MGSSLPNQQDNVASSSLDQTLNPALNPTLQKCFYQKDGNWYIHMPEQDVGPYDDKADAQMALMYYSVRALWHSERQLRSFTRHGG